MALQGIRVNAKYLLKSKKNGGFIEKSPFFVYDLERPIDIFSFISEHVSGFFGTFATDNKLKTYVYFKKNIGKK